MKKASFFVIAFLSGVLLINSHPQFSVYSQMPERSIKDRDLARRIRDLTNRSVEGLTETKTSDSGTSLDLEDRFQNVMLSHVDASGEPVAACVTSVEEANDFFGRNLETGEIVTSRLFHETDKSKIAARHGMSRDEFAFYVRLIEEATIRRTSNPAAATINIVNGDGAGEGFNDLMPTTPEGNNLGVTSGQQRLNLFNFAAGIWGAFLDTNVPININAQFNSLTPCSTGGGVLGSAGTVNVHRDFRDAQFPGTWYHAALANKRAGSDLNANPEINARFNTDVDSGCLGAGTRFYYGLDNATPPGRINLLVVLLHEMGHGLGFSSFANGSTGALLNGMPDIYTRQMFDRSTGKHWFEMTDAERQASALNNNNVLWDGANVKDASGWLVNGRETGTGRVMLFTPNVFQSGSSVSHFSTAASPNLLMEPSITNGLPINLDLTRQLMRDLGWYRDTTADVIPDTITNVRPSGGTLVPRSTVNITWTNNGGFDRNVTIDLSIDGGATYSSIASDIVNNGSFNFTVPNSITSQARIRIREHNFIEPAGISSTNFSIGTRNSTGARTKFDFDGDGKADMSVFRPSSGAWYLQQSTQGFTGVSFGQLSDRIVPADYDGDGKTDVAVYRNGIWYLNRSEAGFTGVAFGASEDIPVPADFNGDGKAELATFRPSNGNWYIYDLSNNQTSGASFGAVGDKPVAADYDGDGKADVAVFRPSNGTWYLQRSQLGFTVIAFGEASDNPIPADFDGDGKTDVAVFRPSNGTWYLQRSTLGFTGISFGTSGDIPVPADYDGDNRTDIAVYRNGTWYLQQTANGFTGASFGNAADYPAQGAYVF